MILSFWDTILSQSWEFYDSQRGFQNPQLSFAGFFAASSSALHSPLAAAGVTAHTSDHHTGFEMLTQRVRRACFSMCRYTHREAPTQDNAHNRKHTAWCTHRRLPALHDIVGVSLHDRVAQVVCGRLIMQLRLTTSVCVFGWYAFLMHGDGLHPNGKLDLVWVRFRPAAGFEIFTQRACSAQ
jgi:hypothetical protein